MTTPDTRPNCHNIAGVTPEGAVMQLADGRIYAANPSAEHILGLTLKQMKKLSPEQWPWHMTHEDGSSFADDLYPHMVALKTGRPCHDVAVCITRADNTQAWVSLNAEPLFNNSHSKPYAVVTTFSDVTGLKNRELEIHQLNSLMRAVRLINEHLLVTRNETELYRFICDTLYALEHVAAVWVELRNPDASIKPVAWAGIDANRIYQNPPDGEKPDTDCCMLSMAIEQHAPIIAEDIEHDERFFQWRRLREWNVIAGAGIPLFLDGEAIGGLVIFSDQSSFFNEVNVRFLNEVAGDIAVGIRTLRLDHRLQATLNNLRESLNATIATISGIVEYRDPYTAGHERRVAQLASAIGRELSLPERMIEGLRVAGYIHDLGKIAIPAEILSKPSRLSTVELQLVREHARTGYTLLKNLDFPWPIAQVVLQHHERLDGSGYPQGLKGEQIIPEARILMVADVVEAISSHRPYRAALGIESALLELKNNRERFYDPQVVDACLTLFDQHRFAFDERQTSMM